MKFVAILLSCALAQLPPMITPPPLPSLTLTSSPTPTPTPTTTPTPTSTSTPTPTPTPTPTQRPTPTPTTMTSISNGRTTVITVTATPTPVETAQPTETPAEKEVPKASQVNMQAISTTLIILGCGVLVAALGIFILRRWKLRPSRDFQSKMEGNESGYQATNATYAPNVPNIKYAPPKTYENIGGQRRMESDARFLRELRD